MYFILSKLDAVLRRWKPIHLCRWFEKHGWQIPRYLVGGGAIVDQRNWIIGDDDNADPDLCTWDTENTARTGQAKTVDFMLRFQIAEDGGGALNNANWQVWFNTIDSIDLASQVLTTGTIVKISNTGTPTDQDPTTQAVMTAQAESWLNGLYTENADESGKKSIPANNYSEFQFCVQFLPAAGNSTDYFFWVYANDVKLNGTYNSPTCKVTTEAGGTAHFASISDTVGITDTLTNKRDIIKSISDTVGITDVLSRLGTFFRSAANTVGITDSRTTARSIVKTIADTVGITDAISILGTFFRSLADTEGITDTLSAFKVVFVDLADTEGITDTRITARGIVKLLADTEGITDTRTTKRDIFKNISDTVGITDTISILGTFFRSISDTEGITDTLMAFKVVFVDLADTVGITDTISRIGTFFRDITDTVGITDAVDSGLIGLWRLNTGFGGIAYDGSGYGNNGTLEGTSPTWVTGKSGTCVNFPGTNERIDCGNGVPLDDIGNGDFSISFWMKSKDVIPLTWGRLFNKYADSENRINLSSYNTTNRIYFIFEKNDVSNSGAFSAETTPFDTNWNHIVLIINRTTDLALLYMNTVKDTTEIDISTIAEDASNTGNLCWGARDQGSNPYEGLIDEYRVYNRVLTENEIEFLYAYPSGIAINTTRNIIKLITDTVGITDIISTTGAFFRSVADTVGITDILTARIPKKASLADTVGITDTISTTGAFFRSIMDTVGITDVLTRLGTFFRSIIDTIGIADSITTKRGLVRFILDTEGITDTISTVRGFIRSIADTVGVVDTLITYIKKRLIDSFGKLNIIRVLRAGKPDIIRSDDPDKPGIIKSDDPSKPDIVGK